VGCFFEKEEEALEKVFSLTEGRRTKGKEGVVFPASKEATFGGRGRSPAFLRGK